jgi:hypothetical protein
VQQPRPKDDRRNYPRHELNSDLSVELRVEMSGDSPAMLLTRGLVSDISCGGLRCDIDLDVPVGTRVDIRFTEIRGDGLAPQSLDGHVVRTVSVGGVPEQVVIAFAQPLDHLDPDALQAPESSDSLRGRTAVTRRASWADEPQGFATFATGSLL